MRRFILIYIAIAIACILSLQSCRTGGVSAELDYIETYINEYPDSALSVLQNINEDLLHGRSNRNHYNLLLAQAKDKCFIDETEDSVMLSVVNYYSNRRDEEKLFRAYYYLGRIRQNAGRYTESIMSYLDAEQLIDYSDNELQKGLLYAHFGKLYEYQMDFSGALSAYEKASYYYDRAGSLPHQYYTTLDVGHLYLRMCKYEAAEPLIKDAMEWLYQSGNFFLTGYACDLLCMLYEATGDFQSLSHLLDSKYAVYYSDSVNRNLSLAYKYARDNRFNRIQQTFDNAWAAAVSATDTATIYHQEYIVYKLMGQDNNALASHEKLLAIQDSLVRAALQQPLHYIQADYFKTKASYTDLKARSRYTIAIILISLLILIICFIIISFKRKIENKNLEIERFIDQVAGLKNDIDKRVAEAAVMISDIDRKDSDIRSMEESIAELFSKQYKFLDKMCSVYYETHGCGKDKDAIYKQVKIEIERFSTDKRFLRELEGILNLHLDGVMKTLRTELPHLSEMDFRLLCFLLAGFSAKAISVFTGDSTGNIYVRKSRLKNEIQAIAPQVSTKIPAFFI